MDEYFLIVYSESSDEIHFLLMGMEHYKNVNGMLDKLTDRKTPFEEIGDFLSYCYSNSIDVTGKGSGNFWLQTYCDDNWPFGGYNIKKIISIPEFGM